MTIAVHARPEPRADTILFHSLRALGRSRSDLLLENLALRQQIALLTKKMGRPRWQTEDRVLWLALRRSWRRWRDALVLVKPDTVVAWHRKAFRSYWSALSRAPGRPRLDAEVRQLIVRMACENATWGAPRIHGELLKLGFNVSERTVSRYLPRIRGRAGERSARGGRSFGITARRCRRELLDRVVVLHEGHLRRLLREYVGYDSEDRCHLALEKDAPDLRPVQPRPSRKARVASHRRVGGLHHRYAWREAA